MIDRYKPPTDRVAVVGIDVGGTFIDYVALQDGEPIGVHKVLNRPDALATAILDGLAEVAPGGVTEVVHGTTVGTNAIIERRGAQVALVTTRGFADVIEIGRQDRPVLYALVSDRPRPLVDPDHRFEFSERVAASGEVLIAPTADEVERLCSAVAASGPQAVAVCLLFSFFRPEHERIVATALREAGVGFVTTSTEVIPEYREYERTSTTVANAYVSPLLAAYLGDVRDGLRRDHDVDRFEIMQSNAGVLTADEAADNGVRLLLSGPAGGVAGAFALGQAHGIDRIISFDMGGTSTDVALCDGSIPTSVERVVAGVPVRVPMVDIETVGAGGGSIARLDSGGALRVGPESAGADPGPACFGRGTLATVTDAQAVCGLLDPDSFLGGALTIDLDRARDAVGALAREMGVSQRDAARGVLTVANASIEQAIRQVSIQRGFDPRDFTLVAFGGAGPLQACAVADGLGIRRILIPPHPGVMSALGMAQADAVRDFSQSVLGRPDSVASTWTALEAAAMAALPGSQVTRSIDCRYRGQGYELEIETSATDTLADAFHAAHLRRFGFENRDREIELVTARVRARRPRALPVLGSTPVASPTPVPRTAPVAWEGRELEIGIHDRHSLCAGDVVDRPSLIVQVDSAVWIAPGWRATVTDLGAMILEVDR